MTTEIIRRMLQLAEANERPWSEFCVWLLSDDGMRRRDISDADAEIWDRVSDAHLGGECATLSMPAGPVGWGALLPVETIAMEALPASIAATAWNTGDCWTDLVRRNGVPHGGPRWVDEAAREELSTYHSNVDAGVLRADLCGIVGYYDAIRRAAWERVDAAISRITAPA